MELILAAVFGIGVGVLTGLAPGIHVNLVCSLLFAALPWIPLSTLAIAIFIISVATTHTFLDAIPSVFLGAPDSASALSALPGHRYLLQGKGLLAVRLSSIGALAGLLLGLISFTGFSFATELFERIPKSWLGMILLAIPLGMLVRERHWKPAIVVIILASLLGIVGFRYPDPLFPMLSGLFGTAMLLLGLRDIVSIPDQLPAASELIPSKDLVRAVLGGLLAGGLTAVLPGVGAAHAAVVGMLFAAGTGDHGFIALTGAIGTTNFFLSLAAYDAIGSARNGALLAATSIAPNLPVAACVGAALFAGGIAVILTGRFASIAGKLLPKIPYRSLSLGVIVSTTSLVFLLGGLAALGIFVCSTAIGMLSATGGCARAHAMSCILIPVGLRFVGVPV